MITHTKITSMHRIPPRCCVPHSSAGCACSSAMTSRAGCACLGCSMRRCRWQTVPVARLRCEVRREHMHVAALEQICLTLSVFICHPDLLLYLTCILYAGCQIFSDEMQAGIKPDTESWAEVTGDAIQTATRIAAEPAAPSMTPFAALKAPVQTLYLQTAIVYRCGSNRLCNALHMHRFCL